MSNEQATPVLDYYGTGLRYPGHYFYKLEGDRFLKSEVYFDHIPFSPEKIVANHEPNGTVKFLQIEGLSICAIAGSCADHRTGCKSVFWIEGQYNREQMKALILSIPIASQIINKMPFEVKWGE